MQLGQPKNVVKVTQVFLQWYILTNTLLVAAVLVSAAGFFFLEMQGIAFVGRENVKNIQKTNKNFYCLEGKFKLRRGEGEFPP